MDISKYKRGYTLFATYCDGDEIDDAINEAKNFCKNNNLNHDIVRIVLGKKEISNKITYFVLVLKK